MKNSKIKWITYLSATSVYGDHKGNWVNELSQTKPTSFNGSERLKVEQEWLKLANKKKLPFQIFRLSGIYSDKYNAIQRLMSGTANIIKKNGIKCKKINKVSGGSPHIVDVLNSKKIALVINTGGGKRSSRIQDSTSLRRATLINKVPYCTNMSTAYACLEGIKSLKSKKITVTSLQDIK